MSLTREQWEAMWASTRQIERSAQEGMSKGIPKQTILAEVRKMQEQIQSVIGQQEGAMQPPREKPRRRMPRVSNTGTRSTE